MINLHKEGICSHVSVNSLIWAAFIGTPNGDVDGIRYEIRLRDASLPPTLWNLIRVKRSKN